MLYWWGMSGGRDEEDIWALMLADPPDIVGSNSWLVTVQSKELKNPLKLGLSGGLSGGFVAIVK